MKKIMFNDRYALTEAVLTGRKTQTRRIATNAVLRTPSPSFETAQKAYVGCDQKHYRGYTEENLEQLCSVLSGIKGKFILSGFPHKILTDHTLRNGWQFVEENMHLSVCNYHNNAPVNKRRKTEVLIYNYQIPELNLF